MFYVLAWNGMEWEIQVLYAPHSAVQNITQPNSYDRHILDRILTRLNVNNASHITSHKIPSPIPTPYHTSHLITRDPPHTTPHHTTHLRQDPPACCPQRRVPLPQRAPESLREWLCPAHTHREGGRESEWERKREREREWEIGWRRYDNGAVK